MPLQVLRRLPGVSVAWCQQCMRLALGSRTCSCVKLPSDAHLHRMLSTLHTSTFFLQDFLGLTDRVHDVSPFVSAPCGQALLECPGGDSRVSPDAMQLTCVDAGCLG